MRRTRITSRNFIIILTTAVALFLVACGGGETDSSTEPQATSTAVADTPVETERVLNIYNWDTYIDPDIITSFEEEYDVTVNYETFDSNEELLDVMSNNDTNYDIIVPTDYMVSVLIRRQMLHPLTKDNIPNLSNISEDFLNLSYDPGGRYCAPYQWGTMGIGYNIAVIGQELTSWQDILNPDYQGRVSLLDDGRSVLGAFLLHLGYSPNTTNERQIDEARQLLLDNIDQFAAFAPDTGQDLLNNGDVDIAFEWSGDLFQIMEDNPDIRYVVPEEGTIVWTDNMCIPANAPHPELAETFINYILDPEVGAQLSDYIRYATPNEASLALIDEDDRNNPSLYPPDEVRRRLFFTADLGPEMNEYYDQVWSEVLSAGN